MWASAGDRRLFVQREASCRRHALTSAGLESYFPGGWHRNTSRADFGECRKPYAQRLATEHIARGLAQRLSVPSARSSTTLCPSASTLLRFRVSVLPRFCASAPPCSASSALRASANGFAQRLSVPSARSSATLRFSASTLLCFRAPRLRERVRSAPQRPISALFRGSVLQRFNASVLPRLRASVLPRFRASALPCFRASVLPRFRASALPRFRASALPRCRAPRLHASATPRLVYSPLFSSAISSRASSSSSSNILSCFLYCM